jgi:hypothetical protein
MACAGVVLILLVLGALFLATPVYEEFRHRTLKQYSDAGPYAVDIHCSKCDLDLCLQNDVAAAMDVSGRAQGFGFPTNKISHVLRETVVRNVPTVFFDLRQKGFFSELVNTVHIDLKKPGLVSLNITVGEGDVVIRDGSDNGLTASRLVINVRHGTLTLPRFFPGKAMILNVPDGGLKYR